MQSGMHSRTDERGRQVLRQHLVERLALLRPSIVRLYPTSGRKRGISRNVSLFKWTLKFASTVRHSSL